MDNVYQVDQIWQSDASHMMRWCMTLAESACEVFLCKSGHRSANMLCHFPSSVCEFYGPGSLRRVFKSSVERPVMLLA